MQRVSHANLQNPPAYMQPQTDSQSPHAQLPHQPPSCLSALSRFCSQVGHGTRNLLSRLNPLHIPFVRRLVMWFSSMRQPPSTPTQTLRNIVPIHSMNGRARDQSAASDASRPENILPETKSLPIELESLPPESENTLPELESLPLEFEVLNDVPTTIEHAPTTIEHVPTTIENEQDTEIVEPMPVHSQVEVEAIAPEASISETAISETSVPETSVPETAISEISWSQQLRKPVMLSGIGLGLGLNALRLVSAAPVFGTLSFAAGISAVAAVYIGASIVTNMVSQNKRKTDSFLKDATIDVNAAAIASEPDETQRTVLLKQRQIETEFFQQKTLGETLHLCVATKSALFNTALPMSFPEDHEVFVPLTMLLHQCSQLVNQGSPFSSLTNHPLNENELQSVIEITIKQQVIDGNFNRAFQSLSGISATQTELKNSKIAIAREMLRLAQLHMSYNVTHCTAKAVREERKLTAIEQEMVLAHLQSYKEARDAFAALPGAGIKSDRDLSSFNQITHELAVGLKKPETIINEVFHHLKTPLESVHAMSVQPLPKKLAVSKNIKTENTLKIACDDYHFTSGNHQLYIGKNDKGQNVFSISDVSSGHCIFSSVPGKPFLQAGLHKNVIKESRGSFHITENTILHSLDQRIHEIVPEGNTVKVKGTIVHNKIETKDVHNKIETREVHNQHEKRDISQKDAIIPYELSISFNEDDQVNIQCRTLGNANFIHLIYASSESEKIYGLGEQYTYLNQKGHEVPILVQEQGIGAGHPYITPVMNFLAGSGGTYYTSYAAVPHYITQNGLSVEVKNSEYAVFNFKEKDSNTLRLFSDHIEINMIQKSNVMQAIEARATSFNNAPKLPDWMNKGAIVGMQGGTAPVLKVLDELEARKTPIAAVWLQDWVGKRKNLIGEQLWWNWELDEKHYPDWDKLVARCRSQDIRLMGYINPYLVKLDQKAQVKRDLFKEAEALGYLVKKENGDLYPLEITTFSSYLIDLSNPAARTWTKEIIKTQMIDKGFSGWMADFGEGLPMDAALYSGDAKSFHNHYPEEWAKLNLEAIREAGKEDEITFFARSGFTRSPESVPLLWTGDQLHTDDEFDGMKAALRAINSSGFSGFKRNHSDIGGYTTFVLPRTSLGWVRTEDLLFRWMAMNAFTCAFRTHEGLKPQVNAQFYSNERCYDMFDHFAKTYESLAFYRQQLEQEAQSLGRPITRHPILHYPHDSVIADLKDQFMLGSEIMVAPVFDQKAFTEGHCVYLPKGDWVSPWHEKGSLPLEYQHNNGGEWITVKSDYKHPPVFYKKDSLVGAQFIKNLEAYGIDRALSSIDLSQRTRL